VSSSDGAPARRFPLLGAVLTVLLITVTGLTILAWVSLTLAYGAGSIWPVALVLGLLPALLIALSARMLFVALLDRPPSYLAVAAVAYAVIVLVAAGSVWAADRAYEAGAARAADACSADEVAALRGIVLSDALAEDPSGERDGSCVLATSLTGDRTAVDAALADAMGRAGFTAVGDELATRTFERDRLTVVATVGVTDDKGQTDVSLSIPPG
jgi:hypothetical protein